MKINIQFENWGSDSLPQEAAVPGESIESFQGEALLTWTLPQGGG